MNTNYLNRNAILMPRIDGHVFFVDEDDPTTKERSCAIAREEGVHIHTAAISAEQLLATSLDGIDVYAALCQRPSLLLINDPSGHISYEQFPVIDDILTQGRELYTFQCKVYTSAGIRVPDLEYPAAQVNQVAFWHNSPESRRRLYVEDVKIWARDTKRLLDALANDCLQ